MMMPPLIKYILNFKPPLAHSTTPVYWRRYSKVSQSYIEFLYGK